MITRNVRDYGAVGDGVTMDTKAIQNAIDAGGIVSFPPGTYLTGTLYLRSNGGLEVQSGAVLMASPNLDDYNAADFTPQNWASKAEVTSGGHLIAAVECENITLMGGGVIDGNHSAFLNEPREDMPFMYKRPMRPAQMIFICECRNVHVRDLELRNSPYWTSFFHGCEDVTITGLHIYSHPMVINDDGIDIDCCSRVTISDCIIDSGDDSITLRGNPKRLKNKRDCEYITVTNCVLTSRYANAIRVGVGAGRIHDAIFSNLVITGYRTALSIVSNYSNNPADCDGVDISAISFCNIRSTARRLLALKLDNNRGTEAKTSGSIRDITLSHVRGTMELTSEITGNGVGTVSEIILDDVRLHNIGKGPAEDQDFKGAWGHSSTDAALEVTSATDVLLRNSKIFYIPENAAAWTCECRSFGSDVTLDNSPLRLQKN